MAPGSKEGNAPPPKPIPEEVTKRNWDLTYKQQWTAFLNGRMPDPPKKAD